MFIQGRLAYHEPMRIVCPSCSATYDVPETRLAPGLSVRCARCSADWAPLPIAPPPAPEGVPEPVRCPAARATEFSPTLFPPAPEFAGDPLLSSGPEAAEPIEAPGAVPAANDHEEAPAGSVERHGTVKILAARKIPPSPVAALIGWVLTLILLAALGWTAVSQRGRIMQAWPPSTRAYTAIGLPP